MEYIVRQVREALGISMHALARTSGLPLSTLADRERGKRQFTGKQLERCAQALTTLSGKTIPIEALYRSVLLRPTTVCVCGAVVLSCGTPGCPTHQGVPRQIAACGVCQEAHAHA